MDDNEYKLTKNELSIQIHRVLKDLYPTLEISGDNIQKFIIKEKLDFHFFAQMLAIEIKLDSSRLIDDIYLELMVEYEKNWHDRVFFRILKDKKKISFKKVE
ncbi:MAG: hypothetical protein GY865_04335 [candidate division Zixibacteria bacterium]|nr:hypothetical protein [candidate division Zixibacteria bacterium]